MSWDYYDFSLEDPDVIVNDILFEYAAHIPVIFTLIYCFSSNQRVELNVTSYYVLYEMYRTVAEKLIYVFLMKLFKKELF